MSEPEYQGSGGEEEDTRTDDEIMADYLAGTGEATPVAAESSVIREAQSIPVEMTVEEQKAQPHWKPDPDKADQVAQVEHDAMPMLQRLIADEALVTFMLAGGHTVTGHVLNGDGDPKSPFLFVNEPAHDVVDEQGNRSRTTPVTWRIPKDRVIGVGQFIE